MNWGEFKSITDTRHEMKCAGSGRPGDSLTDKKWQQEFAVHRLHISPHGKKMKKMGGRYSRLSAKPDGGECLYCGETNWSRYCSFINSVLDSIRKGERDYCFFKYQIYDILRFHWADLRTRYVDGYWEVWLER